MAYLTYHDSNVTLLTQPETNTTSNISTLCLDGTDSSLNISVLNLDEYMFDKTFNYPKHVFEVYVTPIMYIMGIPGNALSAYIWLRPRMRQSSGIYLAALAIANSMFLFLHIFYYSTVSWGSKVLNTPGWCELYPFLSMVFQYLSPILVLGFTVERYISICHPFKREKLCTQRRAMITVACIYAGAVLLCVIHTYFWYYSTETGICDVRPTVLKGDSKSLWTIWTWITEMLIFLVVPLGVLCFNIIVIFEAQRLSRAATVLNRGNTERKSATTFMLLAVSFYLIFTTLPIAVSYALVRSFPIGDMYIYCKEYVFEDRQWTSYLTFALIRAVIQMMGTSHYAGNFYIYLLTGKMFRREVQTAILGKCSSKLNRRYSSVSTRNGDTSLTSLKHGDR